MMDDQHDESEQKRGVTQDREEFFDSFSIETAGLGAQRSHDVLNCPDLSCGHPAHGNSTAGPNLSGNDRAGDVYDGEGQREPGRDDRTNDPRIAAGNVVDILEAVAQHAAGEACTNPQCQHCNAVNGRTLQPSSRVEGSGGGSSGPKGKAGTQVCDVEGCGLTLCEHLAGSRRHAGGRKAKGPRSRNKTLTAKVSATAKQGYKTPGAIELIDELGFAIQNGLTISAARVKLGLDQTSQAA